MIALLPVLIDNYYWMERNHLHLALIPIIEHWQYVMLRKRLVCHHGNFRSLRVGRVQNSLGMYGGI